MPSLLLATKLHVPSPRVDLVPRPHLIERLDEGVRLRHRLTLVSAPAGFGKTTLLSAWAAAGSWPVAWLALDRSDNDPARFLAYLVAALGKVCEQFEGALFLAQSPERLSIEETLTPLINELDLLPGPLVLVLDDYHVIGQPEVHRALTFMLDHLPAQVHLVVSTRSDPPLPLARLRARGQLTELRQADLCFAPDEAALLLQHVAGRPLPVHAALELAARTEGWAAGLQLAALSLRDREDVSAFVATFAGGHEHVADLFTNEVLGQQPEEVRSFLLTTSILERLSGPLCDAVTGGEGGWQTLERLVDANLFLLPLDNERRWYRYHHLFVDLLRRRLQRACPELVPTLHGRASEWYEGEGLAEEAIAHALSAGDFGRAARLAEGAAPEALMRGEIATLQGWVDPLPGDVLLAHPLLRLLHAWVLMMAGRPLEDVEEALDDVRGRDVGGLVAGELAALDASVAMLRADVDRAVELCHRALDLLPEQDLFFRGVVVRCLGGLQKLAGEAEAAAGALEEAIRMGRRAGDALGVTAALHQLGDMRFMQGRLREAGKLYREALELAGGRRGRMQLMRSRALTGLGRFARERNDLDTAADHLCQAIELGRGWPEAWALNAQIGLARVKSARGDLDGADRVFAGAEDLAAEIYLSAEAGAIVSAHRARLRLRQGELAAALEWVQARGLDDGVGKARSALVGEVERVTLARVRLAQGRAAEALDVLAALASEAEAAGRMGSVIENLVLQALALEQQGESAQALACLERALGLAGPEGYVRLFVEEGEPMVRLLAKVKAHSTYAARLLAALRPGGPPPPPRAPAQPPDEPLTEREVQVLRLLATRLSGPEIADELFVAVSTVRTHTKRIYAKLGVHRRSDAVARARELGIIPE